MEALSKAVGSSARQFAHELRTLAGVAAVLALLGLAACGGGDLEDDETPQTSVSQPDDAHTARTAGPQPGTGPH